MDKSEQTCAALDEATQSSGSVITAALPDWSTLGCNSLPTNCPRPKRSATALTRNFHAGSDEVRDQAGLNFESARFGHRCARSERFRIKEESCQAMLRPEMVQ